MEPAQGEEDMLASLKGLIPAVLLLSATGALADSSMPDPKVPVREIVTRTPAETPKNDEQLRSLTREIESLETDVHALQAQLAEKGLREVQYLDQSTHPMWP
jgi:TolA-binding protein